MQLNTIALLISPSRLHQALVAVESARKFAPELDINIAYFGSSLPSEEQRALFGNHTYWHLKGAPQHFKEIYRERPKFILDLFAEGYECVLHIGADIFFLNDFSRYFKDYNWICPHLINLPVNADKSNSIHKTGLLNADLMHYVNKPSAREFLNWHYNMLCQQNDNQNGFFYDQRYYDHGIMSGHIGVNTDPRSNIAYWNLEERLNVLSKAITFQFSGFVEQLPAMLTRYKVDRKLLTFDVVNLALTYGELLHEAKERLKLKA